VTVGTTKYDAIISVPENTASSATTLWTSASNGANPVSAATFTVLAIIVDPDEDLSTSLPLNLKFTYTAASGGTTTGFTHGVRASREAPLVLTASNAGATGSAFTPYLTKVEAYNEDTASAVTVRVLVLG